MRDWRPLLDSIRVPWRDRGPNTSAGNVNIACPFCRDDQGFHLSIAEESDAYYCYRNPRMHSGYNLNKLLIQLGVSRHESFRLLNAFLPSQRNRAQARQPPTPATSNHAPELWDRFAPAYEFAICRDYLSYRGYPDPIGLSRRFDLRASATGIWAGRLLLPVRLDGSILSFVGRALRPSLEPKYRVEAQGDRGAGLIYIADEAPLLRHHATVCLVEGPLDALKIAAANPGPQVAAVALMGVASNAARLLRLGSALANAQRIAVCLDRGVALNEWYGAVRGLSQMGLKLRAQVIRKPMPPGVKDPGEMAFDEIHDWLGNLIA